MARTVEYYLTQQSPWTYLGHAVLMNLAAKHDAVVAFKPVKLGEVFAASGGLPLGKRHVARQRYRIVELQRWAEAHGLPMNIHPQFWPFNAALADKVVIAMVIDGLPAASVVGRMFTGTFEREEDIGNETVLKAILDEAGFDGNTILQAAKSETIETAYAANTAQAIERGVIGAPAYVLDGEVFWGQDRLPHLDAALTSGRAPFSSDA